MLFDGLPAELPTATLRSGSRHARHRVLSGHLVHWLVNRWAWLRPRTLPMIAAFVGLLAVLGATSYLSAYARGDDQRATVIYGEEPPARWLANARAQWLANTRDACVRTVEAATRDIAIVNLDPAFCDSRLRGRDDIGVFDGSTPSPTQIRIAPVRPGSHVTITLTQ